MPDLLGPWTPNTAYAEGDRVRFRADAYRCIAGGVSGDNWDRRCWAYDDVFDRPPRNVSTIVGTIDISTQLLAEAMPRLKLTESATGVAVEATFDDALSDMFREPEDRRFVWPEHVEPAPLSRMARIRKWVAGWLYDVAEHVWENDEGDDW